MLQSFSYNDFFLSALTSCLKLVGAIFSGVFSLRLELNNSAQIELPLKEGLDQGALHASFSCNFQANTSRRCLRPNPLKQ